MFASKHPLEDTLVLEIPRGEILELHGILLQAQGIGLDDPLISILETFNAGQSLERFERPDEAIQQVRDETSDFDGTEQERELEMARLLRLRGIDVSS